MPKDNLGRLDLHIDRPTKRPKTRLACEECRDRKIRCDGARPICNSCTKKKRDTCRYTDSGTHVDQKYVLELEKKIRQYECGGFPSQPVPAKDQDPLVSHSQPLGHDRTLADMNEPQRYSSIDMDFEPAANVTVEDSAPILRGSQHPDLAVPSSTIIDVNRSTSAQRIDPHILASPLERRSCTSNDLQESLEVSAPTMGAAQSTPGDNSRVFLGRSSAAAFMKEISQATPSKRMHASLDSPISHSDSRSVPLTRSKDEADLQSLMESLVLPPRRVADAHLRNYWMYVHPHLPAVHRPTFMRRYERVWHEDDVEGRPESDRSNSVQSVRAFYRIFNIVLALGCAFAPDGIRETTKRSAEVYFSRSEALAAPDDIDNGSIAIVQVFILKAQYLQGSDLINRCWVTIGMAIRLAQGIGVHLDPPVESQAEREERRRIWWSCVLMDRVHSMTFGRPPMVVWPSVVPFPALVDDDDLSTEPFSSAQPLVSNDHSLVEAFVHALKLSNILMEVLKIFYAPAIEVRNETSILQDFKHIQKIDANLATWDKELPKHLRCEPKDSARTSSVFVRQAITLKCRYLHLQILLYRPITMRLAQHSVHDGGAIWQLTTVQRAVVAGSINSCTKAAQQLISAIHSELGVGDLPPWWYVIFYLYTAGTVILAALFIPAIRESSNEPIDSLEATWTQCIGSLASYPRSDVPQDRDTFARRCLLMLQSARDQFENHQNDREAIQSRDFPGLPNSEQNVDLGLPQIVDSFEGILNENVYFDTWWSNGGINWLNDVDQATGS